MSWGRGRGVSHTVVWFMEVGRSSLLVSSPIITYRLHCLLCLHCPLHSTAYPSLTQHCLLSSLSTVSPSLTQHCLSFPHTALSFLPSHSAASPSLTQHCLSFPHTAISPSLTQHCLSSPHTALPLLPSHSTASPPLTQRCLSFPHTAVSLLPLLSSASPSLIQQRRLFLN